MTKHLGAYIVEARKKYGLTQLELAELLEVTRNYIAQLEIGRRLPSLELLVKLSVLTAQTPDDLIRDEPIVQKIRKDVENRKRSPLTYG
jgi:transcriptional regulator with XRE-family HTH domain